MSILVFEFISGGGLHLCSGLPSPAGSLATEGAAIARAIVEDLARCSAAPVTQLVDARLPPALTSPRQENVNRVVVGTRADLDQALHDHARACDLVLAIAPETDRLLTSTQQIVEGAGGRLLGCSAEMLAWACDKTGTIDRLAAAGNPVPRGVTSVGEPAHMPDLPLVVKPNDGAGSEDTYFVRGASEWDAIPWRDRLYRIETYYEGQPASLAVLCGPNDRQMLTPCLQFIDPEDAFSYRGGRVLPRGALADRADALCANVLPVLDGALGFIGLDLVLGSATDGSEDLVIEVNPRLTTSYVGLRAAFDGNLGRALLDVADGRTVPLDFPNVPVEFRADGTILQQSRQNAC